MKRVLVLDACQRSALAVTRSLGRQGVAVFTSDETPFALAAASRYSKQYFSSPSPRLQPRQFIEALAHRVTADSIDILLPMTELTTTLLLENQDAFTGTILPFPDMQQVDSLANKCSLMRNAASHGIPIPHTWHIEQPGDLDSIRHEITYPAVLKPGKSWLCLDGTWSRAAVQFATDEQTLDTLIRDDPALQAHPFMIQSCVAGKGQGVFALYDRGEPLAFFAHQRLREKPPRGGVSVLSESIAVDPDLEAYARTLLGNARWHGVAMVEFKVAPDGTPYLMEINTRFWGSLQLAIDAGVDFPWLLYQAASGMASAPVEKYREGIRVRWILGDLDSLYLTLRDGEFSIAEKLATVGKFLLPAPFKTRHEINRWSDWKPFSYEVKMYIRDLVG